MSRPHSLSVRDHEGQMDYQFKVLLIGDSGVGKTSIMNRFTEDTFSQETKSTIGVEYSKKAMIVDKTLIQASIWDTAGQERFRALAKTYYKGALGALLVFDVNRPNTLENIHKIWIQEVKTNASEKIKMILIGNKADLTEDRKVKKEDALLFAQQYNLAYIETSALSDLNITSAFESLMREIFAEVNVLPPEIRPKNLTMRDNNGGVAGIKLNTPVQAPNIKKKKCC